MHKKYSRKDFIKLGALAGTGLLLAACGANDNEEQKKTIITKYRARLKGKSRSYYNSNYFNGKLMAKVYTSLR